MTGPTPQATATISVENIMENKVTRATFKMTSMP